MSVLPATLPAPLSSEMSIVGSPIDMNKWLVPSTSSYHALLCACDAVLLFNATLEVVSTCAPHTPDVYHIAKVLGVSKPGTFHTARHKCVIEDQAFRPSGADVS